MRRGELAKAAIVSPRRYTIRELLRQPALVVWCLYLAATPFYIVSSGLPQPGDALIFLLVPFAFARWDGRFDRQTTRMLRPLLWFTLWVLAVNAGWTVIEWKFDNWKDFLIHPLFYFYNAAVLFAALIIAKPDPARFLRLTFDVVFGMVMFQVAASFFYRTDLYRGTLFFNSPNQLGYYALLAACLFAMAQRPLGLSRLWTGIGVAACAYLAVLSSSRASLAGILILLLLLTFSNPRAVIAGSIVAIALTTLGGPLSDAIEFSEKRTLQNNHNEGFIEERGYDRIIEYPEYLITGAGEGDYQRFANEGQVARELHSSFGSVVFGYGIIGLTLFALFAVRVVRGSSLRAALMLLPPTAYTVAHQGLRFTMFWVLLAGFIALKQAEARNIPP